MSAGYYVCGIRVGHSLAVALVRLYVLGSTTDWEEFALVGRYNAMRHLKARQWIHDLAAPARDDYVEDIRSKMKGGQLAGWPPGCPAPYAKFPPVWLLTPEGERVAKALHGIGVKGWEV